MYVGVCYIFNWVAIFHCTYRYHCQQVKRISHFFLLSDTEERHVTPGGEAAHGAGKKQSKEEPQTSADLPTVLVESEKTIANKDAEPKGEGFTRTLASMNVNIPIGCKQDHSKAHCKSGETLVFFLSSNLSFNKCNLKWSGSDFRCLVWQRSAERDAQRQSSQLPKQQLAMQRYLAADSQAYPSQYTCCIPAQQKSKQSSLIRAVSHRFLLTQRGKSE